MDKAVHCIFMNETVRFVHNGPYKYILCLRNKSTESADIDTTSNSDIQYTEFKREEYDDGILVRSQCNDDASGTT